MAEKKTEKKAKKEKKAERSEQKMRRDHIKVLEFLSQDLPKRPSFKMREIAKAKFKDGPNITADRIARNSVRKPREMGLVEIGERGEYRLTTAGAAFCKNLDDYEVAPDMEREAKAAKKGKKAEKKVAKKAAKAEKKTAKATKKAAKAEKKVEKKAAKKAAEPEKVNKKVAKDLDIPSDDDEEPKANGKSEAAVAANESAEEATAEA